MLFLQRLIISSPTRSSDSSLDTAKKIAWHIRYVNGDDIRISSGISAASQVRKPRDGTLAEHARFSLPIRV
jgi:hypothetical protein